MLQGEGGRIETLLQQLEHSHGPLILGLVEIMVARCDKKRGFQERKLAINHGPLFLHDGKIFCIAIDQVPQMDHEWWGDSIDRIDDGRQYAARCPGVANHGKSQFAIAILLACSECLCSMVLPAAREQENQHGY